MATEVFITRSLLVNRNLNYLELSLFAWNYWLGILLIFRTFRTFYIHSKNSKEKFSFKVLEILEMKKSCTCSNFRELNSHCPSNFLTSSYNLVILIVLSTCMHTHLFLCAYWYVWCHNKCLFTKYVNLQYINNI